MPDTEVVIIGAGPGGLAAALHLGQNDISTLLVDQATFPRDKVCGDGISGWSVDILKKLNPDIIGELAGQRQSLDSWGVRFVAPNLKSLDIPFVPKNKECHEQPAGFIVRRSYFDNFLLEKVKRLPKVTMMEGVRIEDYAYLQDKIVVSDKSGKTTISARLAIVADGAQSVLGRKINGSAPFYEKKHHMAGVRAYFNGLRGNHARNYIEMHYLKKLLPGYFWIFPLPDGQANVGVCMRSDRISRENINLRELMDEVIESNAWLKKRFATAEKMTPAKGFGLPLGSKKRKLSARNIMKVGDAAGLIDPFTGEGIGNAMASGLYAAQHAMKCLDSNDFCENKMRHYDRLVYQKIGNELKLSTVLQHLLRFPWLFNLVVNKAGKNEPVRDMISSMFTDANVKARLKDPLFYLRLLIG